MASSLSPWGSCRELPDPGPGRQSSDPLVRPGIRQALDMGCVSSQVDTSRR